MKGWWCCFILLPLMQTPGLAEEAPTQPQLPEVELTSPSTSSSQLPQPGTARPIAPIRPGQMLRPTQVAVPTSAPYQLGSFLVYPQIDISRLDDSNVYSTNTSVVADQFWALAPALWVQSNWERHALNLHAGLESVRYDVLKSEDSNDHHFTAEGRYDFNADFNLYGGLLVSKDHEDRESPSDRNGLTPTIYERNRLYLGMFRQLDRVSLRLAATMQSLDYKDVDFINGAGVVQPINNDDRDRRQYTGGIRLGYTVKAGLEPYLQMAFDNRRYIDAADDLGYQRDSSGSRYLLGVRWGLRNKLKLDAFAGQLQQNYQDPRFGTINAGVAGAALQWQISPATSLLAQIDRTLEETTVTSTPAPGLTLVSSSYLNTYGTASLTHRLKDTLSLRLSGSLSRVAYQGIDRNDDYQSLGLGMTYRPSTHLIIDLDFLERQLASSTAGEDFKRRIFSVRIVIPFSRRT